LLEEVLEKRNLSQGSLTNFLHFFFIYPLPMKNEPSIYPMEKFSSKYFFTIHLKDIPLR
jgi:hypothetical protein